MKLLEVIPIARGISAETLTYFTASEVAIGSIVKVPLRKKTIPAIVLSLQEVSEAKSSIKDLAYSVRKIKEIKSFDLILPKFMEASKEIADYLAASTGSVMNSIIPKNILLNADKLKIEIKAGAANSRPHEKFVLQADDEERYANYRSFIREEFAKGFSVFFCLPTIQDIKKTFEVLSKGIEQYAFILHSGMPKKEVLKNWMKVLSEAHPVLIIATGSYLSVPRSDIGAIIVDKENSSAYKSQVRPYLDVRKFSEILSEKMKIKMIFGDLLLRTETIWRHGQGEFIEFSPLKFRSLSTATQEIIDMKKIKGESEKSPFKIVSNELEHLVRTTQKNNEHMFIFVARRGLSPTTLCNDCGTIVLCSFCKAPTVLHRSNKENFFLCHRCGERRNALEKCANCDSWNLTALGIGMEKVYEELSGKFPSVKIFKMDADSAPTHRIACQTIKKFYESPGSVLLGTEMALVYLNEKIANSAVVSIDSFFSLPDFRINEKVLNILLKIRFFTAKNFIIQTRDASQKVMEYAVKGNLAEFYRDEINNRESLEYPPFSTLIKITVSGEKKKVADEMDKLEKYLEPRHLAIFPAFTPFAKGKYSMHALMKIPRGGWIDRALLDKLRNLPPYFNINVDPESLL
ncbi:MAG: primosomal protein N' [Patescibacteria group bacterium]